MSNNILSPFQELLNKDFKNFIKRSQQQIEEINKKEILSLNNPQEVGSHLFLYKSIASYLSLYIRDFEDYDHLSYFFDNVNFAEKHYQRSTFENILKGNDVIKKEFDEIFDKNIKMVFGNSEDLIKFNNALLNLAQKYQDQFKNNLDNIGYTDKTVQIQPYFEEHPEIFSFFLSLGLPDKEKQEVFQVFKDLYFTNFIALNIVEDELFNYLASVYAINEIIKMVSYIAPKLMMKEK